MIKIKKKCDNKNGYPNQEEFLASRKSFYDLFAEGQLNLKFEKKPSNLSELSGPDNNFARLHSRHFRNK